MEKIIRLFNRTLIKFSRDKRPDSFPYISGDGFRKLANHIYDETQLCKAEDVNSGDIIFVKSDMLVDFFEKIHPRINERYKLISHNSDENITRDRYLEYIDDKIIHWYAQNLMFQHEKVTVIPIGLENKHIYMHGIPSIFNKISKKKITKINRILFGFNIKTNLTQRQKIRDDLRKNSYADEINQKLSEKEYLTLLNQYKYVASPPGNGVDCHRAWEAIILGTIPLCTNNENSKQLCKIGAPLLLIGDFKNISLNNLKLTDSSSEIIYLDYWKGIILK